jgi:hypothetical protein
LVRDQAISSAWIGDASFDRGELMATVTQSQTSLIMILVSDNEGTERGVDAQRASYLW